MSATVTPPDLTICVIGRNEAHNLEGCAASFSALTEAGILFETLYVDSASTDHSVKIAKRYFDTVIELVASQDLNAGAARAVGTEQARADQILYLDGDMRLSPEFVPFIRRHLDRATTLAGVVGRTHNIYPDGTTDFINFHGNVAGQPCRAFGGAVMLPRQAVLTAGNWALNLFSNEEAELFSRLIKQGSTVLWTEAIMVLHITDKFNNKNKLLGGLLPYRSYLGKKFYGAGQATHLALRQGNLLSFIRLKPLHYLMSVTIVLSFTLLLIKPIIAAWLLALTSLLIVMLRGVKFTVNCLCWTSQVMFGFRRLNIAYRPEVCRVTRQSDASATMP